MTSQTCDRVDVARAAGDGARSLPGAPPLRFGNHPASATERVLGQALRHAGKLAVLDWKFDATDLVHTRFHGRPLDRKTFNDSENCVANAPLRFDKTNARDFEADLEEAVCWCAPARTRTASGGLCRASMHSTTGSTSTLSASDITAFCFAKYSRVLVKEQQ